MAYVGVSAKPRRRSNTAMRAWRIWFISRRGGGRASGSGWHLPRRGNARLLSGRPSHAASPASRSVEGPEAARVRMERSDRVPSASERVVYAYGPTSRNIPNLLRNLRLAWKLVRLQRPRILVTTGAGLAVPFAWIARLHGAYVVYLESIARIDEPSLSLRLIEPRRTGCICNGPNTAERKRRARYRGTVFAKR